MAELYMQEEAGAPVTPASGKWKAYFKAGGFYTLDDAGNEIYHPPVSETIGAFLNSVTIPASTTYHGCPFKVGADATANNFPWPEGGVLSNLCFRKGASAQPASGTLVVTLHVNSVATALTVTVNNADGALALTKKDTTHTVTISPDDQLRWVFQNNATAASTILTSITMTLTK